MPELWELCNVKSQVILSYLNKQEYGQWPEFYHILKGDIKQPPVINAADYQEMEEIEVEREMSRPPSHQKRIE